VSRAREARDRRRERGASAIEFAIVFPLFFALIYIMVSYGLLFALQHSITEAAKESARSTVACDPTLAKDDQAKYDACVTNRARATAAAALDWLPADLRSRILGASNDNVQITFDSDDVAGSKTVEVLVELPNYAADPILPTLTLWPFKAEIPPLPDRLAGRAVVLL
jgi:Flp pilus assembly protein TadG